MPPAFPRHPVEEDGRLKGREGWRAEGHEMKESRRGDEEMIETETNGNGMKKWNGL